MTFSRYSDQCVNCAQYIGNVEEGVKLQMDEAGIECSLELDMNKNQICELFMEAEE